MSTINSKIQPFAAKAYHNGAISEISDKDLLGHWSAVFFYPADFTFVCPTELEDLANKYEEFKAAGIEIYSVSTDTCYAHKAWHDQSPAVGKIRFPMIGDPSGKIARSFGVLIEDEGLALRGTFLVSPEGLVKTAEIHDLGIGRDADELLRKAKAAQYVSAHPGEVCPAKWKEGQASLRPSLDLVGKI